DECDDVARQGSTHRSGLHPLPRRVADLRRGLGLAIAVADRQPPGALHLLDDLWVERLASTHTLSKRQRIAGEIRLNEHPPHGGRCTECRYTSPFDLLQDGFGVEPCVVVDQDGGACVPGGEQ